MYKLHALYIKSYYLIQLICVSNILQQYKHLGTAHLFFLQEICIFNQLFLIYIFYSTNLNLAFPCLVISLLIIFTHLAKYITACFNFP